MTAKIHTIIYFYDFLGDFQELSVFCITSNWLKPDTIGQLSQSSMNIIAQGYDPANVY